MDRTPHGGTSPIRSSAWEVECLMAGDNTSYVVDSSERTFKKGILYAASRMRASLVDFHAVDEASLCPFDEAVADSGTLLYGVSHILGDSAKGLAETRDVGIVRARIDGLACPRVEISLASLRKSRHRSRGEVVRDGIIAWVRKNPGYTLSFGGPGARIPGRKQTNKDLSYMYRKERSLLLDPKCPLRGPGRCLPASVGVACLLFLRKNGGPELTGASIEKVLAYFSSNFISGTSFPRIALFVSNLFYIVKADPALSEVLHGSRLALRRVSNSARKAFVQHCVSIGEDGDGSLSKAQEVIGCESGHVIVFVIRCVSKLADHTFVVDFSRNTIYDCAEQLPLKLCLASLGTCAGIGPEVDADTLFRSIKEFRRVMAHREATSSKHKVVCGLP